MKYTLYIHNTFEIQGYVNTLQRMVLLQDHKDCWQLRSRCLWQYSVNKIEKSQRNRGMQLPQVKLTLAACGYDFLVSFGQLALSFLGMFWVGF